MAVSDEAFGSWTSSKYLLALSITMRSNLLRQANKSAATLFQTSLVFHAIKEVHEDLRINIFDKSYNY